MALGAAGAAPAAPPRGGRGEMERRALGNSSAVADSGRSSLTRGRRPGGQRLGAGRGRRRRPRRRAGRPAPRRRRRAGRPPRGPAAPDGSRCGGAASAGLGGLSMPPSLAPAPRRGGERRVRRADPFDLGQSPGSTPGPGHPARGGSSGPRIRRYRVWCAACRRTSSTRDALPGSPSGAASRCAIASPPGAPRRRTSSALGCQLVTPRLVAPGRTLHLDIRCTPLGRDVLATGRVVWSRPRSPGRIGIEFEVPRTDVGWFDQLLRANPLLARAARRSPVRLPRASPLYLGLPPRNAFEASAEEVAVLRAGRRRHHRRGAHPGARHRLRAGARHALLAPGPAAGGAGRRRRGAGGALGRLARHRHPRPGRPGDRPPGPDPGRPDRRHGAGRRGPGALRRGDRPPGRRAHRGGGGPAAPRPRPWRRATRSSPGRSRRLAPRRRRVAPAGRARRARARCSGPRGRTFTTTEGERRPGPPRGRATRPPAERLRRGGRAPGEVDEVVAGEAGVAEGLAPLADGLRRAPASER